MRKRCLVTRAILHVIASFEGGGAERQLALLATEQARRGMRVHVAVRRLGVHHELVKGVQVHAIGDLAGANPRVTVRIARLVRELRPDVIQTWLPQMDVMAGAAALATRVPWVMTERTSAYRRDAAAVARRAIGSFATAVVANSQEGAALWPAARVIPNAVVVDHAVEAESPAVVFAGRLDDNKQPHVLIDALARMTTPPRTIVFGDGPLRAMLEQRARGLPVTFAGFRTDWHRHLASAIALVAPSRREGEPNVVLEALAYGRPVLASDIAAHRALVEPAFAVGDRAALARALVAPRATSRIELNTRTIAATADRYDEVYRFESARSRAHRT